MRNFQDTSETRKRSFVSACSICMTVPLRKKEISYISNGKDTIICLIAGLIKKT